MAKHKVEVTLKGEFTTIDVFLEGMEIPVRETEDNKYHKMYSAFEIHDNLDIHLLLKGWVSMAWALEIKVDDQVRYSKNGTFDHRGYIKQSDTIAI